MNAQTYDEVFTTHGIIMIFLFIIPGIPVAFGNFFMPIMIGARDVAFPRLNRFTWWLYLTGAAIVVLSLFIHGEPPDTGWTFYAPYSIRTQANIALAVLGVFVLAFFLKRVRGTAAFIGVLAGEATIFAAGAFTSIAWLWYNVIGALVVVAAGWGISLLGCPHEAHNAHAG
jgi:hypothetical protein